MIIKVVKSYEKSEYNGIIKIFGDSHSLCFVGSSFTPLKISIRTADETSTKLPVTI